VELAYAVEIAPASGQDRAVVVERAGGLVIALADGAGGTSAGGVAAQAVVSAVASAPAGTDWEALLEALDADVARRGRGHTTAIVLAIDEHGITGCGVGDSGAWLVGDDVVDLCAGHRRKPFVGDGCFPVPITAGPIGTATLLVASDGLFNYAPHRQIARIARTADLTAAARALIELVRLPAGGLQDDVSVVLCRALNGPAATR
jgi:serine/threonine protein phosphatase PrpC